MPIRKRELALASRASLGYNLGMTIDALIMLSGAFVAVLPFLGFPNSWDTFFFVCAGVLTIALGIVVRRRLGRSEKKTDTSAQFAESAARHDENTQQ